MLGGGEKKEVKIQPPRDSMDRIKPLNATFVNVVSTANLQSAFDQQTAHQSMNNIIISLPKTDVVNTYEFTLAAQFAGRYPMNTVLSSFAKPAPKSATEGFMKKINEAQGTNGSDLIKVDPLIV